MSAPPPGIEAVVIRGVLCVRVHKRELGSRDAERLVEVVFDEAGAGCDRVVIDLAPVEYVNSTVMSALSRISVARELRLVGLQRTVEGILDTMGILQFLERSPSEEAALTDLAGDAGGPTRPAP